ncbi:MAG: NUDIX domain-containing protein [Caldilineaceae bacterium]
MSDGTESAPAPGHPAPVSAGAFGGCGRRRLWRPATCYSSSRGQPPRQGQWGLPGGLLDLGERLETGVRREVREECGIEIEVMDLVAAFEPIQRDDAGRVEYHYVVLDYWARHVSGTAVAADDAWPGLGHPGRPGHLHLSAATAVRPQGLRHAPTSARPGYRHLRQQKDKLSHRLHDPRVTPR